MSKKIYYGYLTENAQVRIDREDPDNQCTFFARKYGPGWKLHSVDNNQLDSLNAQGGMDEGWMEVVFDPDEDTYLEVEE